MRDMNNKHPQAPQQQLHELILPIPKVCLPRDDVPVLSNQETVDRHVRP